MRLPPSHSNGAITVKRQQQGGTQSTLVIIAAVVIGVFVFVLALHFGLKFFVARKSRGAVGDKVKGKRGVLGFVGRLYGRGGDRGAYSASLQQEGSELSPSLPRTEASSGATNHVDPEVPVNTSSGLNASNRNSIAGVDRNTSVRSVMTLPAYSPDVRDNEQVLGREGERGGIDVVLELPETHGEEEERREEEMESLYQIRVARRAEAAQREERRQFRREAREARDRGDLEAARQLRARAASAASAVPEETLSSQLIAEHQLQNRERRVSSVQYADLGVARHDGSRLRANSSESDRRPLLDSAASFADSRPSLSADMGHSRGRSGSSILSLSSQGSEDDLSTHRRPSDFEVISLNHSRNPSVSRSMNDASGDMGAQSIPTIDPPQYDNVALGEPPNYESPVNPRAPQLPVSSSGPSGSRSPTGAPQIPSFDRLPSIRINDESQRRDTTQRAGA